MKGTPGWVWVSKQLLGSQGPGRRAARLCCLLGILEGGAFTEAARPSCTGQLRGPGCGTLSLPPAPAGWAHTTVPRPDATRAESAHLHFGRTVLEPNT